LIGVIHIPDGTGPFPAVIICHPHSQFGGSMDNNIVDGLCEKLTLNSFISLKFNFRGVNGSQGIFDNGVGEKEDALSAITFISSVKEVDQNRIGLAGYSAGAAWGLSAAYRDIRVKALAAISPPLTMFDFAFLQNCTLPKLMVSGSEDDFTPVINFTEMCSLLPEPNECHTIPGADHFWLGFEQVVSTTVTNFFNKTLQLPTAFEKP
jgi:alpha/beta superfamily hydrolase